MCTMCTYLWNYMRMFRSALIEIFFFFFFFLRDNDLFIHLYDFWLIVKTTVFGRINCAWLHIWCSFHCMYCYYYDFLYIFGFKCLPFPISHWSMRPIVCTKNKKKKKKNKITRTHLKEKSDFRAKKSTISQSELKLKINSPMLAYW